MLVSGVYKSAINGEQKSYLQRCQLNVGVPIFKSTFQRSHSLFGLNALRSKHVRYFQVEGNVFPDSEFVNRLFILRNPST
jgi:hypothetical protein